MGNITKNLSRHEFKCPCSCGYDVVDYFLPLILQDCVDHFQSLNPTMHINIKINSGTRCDKHNFEVGGKIRPIKSFNIKGDMHDFVVTEEGSFHLHGRASDFYLYDKNTNTHIDDNIVADYLENKYPNSLGIGRYIGRTHVDTDTNKRRWDNR